MTQLFFGALYIGLLNQTVHRQIMKCKVFKMKRKFNEYCEICYEMGYVLIKYTRPVNKITEHFELRVILIMRGAFEYKVFVVII